MNIIEFLKARIAEDEARAKSCANGGWDLTWRMEGTTVYPLYQMTDGSPNEGNWIPEEHADFIVTNDPARILAECAVKRSLMELYEDEWELHSQLASVYSDHPDYQEAWA